MSAESNEPQEIELAMIPEDGGFPEAARYRVGLAMLLTMLADMAEDVGPVKPEMFHDLAHNLIEGNERGLKLINEHGYKMGFVRIVEASEGGGGDNG